MLKWELLLYILFVTYMHFIESKWEHFAKWNWHYFCLNPSNLITTKGVNTTDTVRFLAMSFMYQHCGKWGTGKKIHINLGNCFYTNFFYCLSTGLHTDDTSTSVVYHQSIGPHIMLPMAAPATTPIATSVPS